MSFSIPADLAEAARRKSDETSIPLSAAVQRLLANWIATGELPPPLPKQAATGKPKKK